MAPSYIWEKTLLRFNGVERHCPEEKTAVMLWNRRSFRFLVSLNPTPLSAGTYLAAKACAMDLWSITHVNPRKRSSSRIWWSCTGLSDFVSYLVVPRLELYHRVSTCHGCQASVQLINSQLDNSFLDRGLDLQRLATPWSVFVPRWSRCGAAIMPKWQTLLIWPSVFIEPLNSSMLNCYGMNSSQDHTHHLAL